MTQIPDPSLVSEIGVVSYLLMAIVLSGVGVTVWTAKRGVSAMDRIADAMTPLDGRLSVIEAKLDRAIALAEEHVAVARLWKTTEAPDRVVRKTDG